jgi:hypothetical protein
MANARKLIGILDAEFGARTLDEWRDRLASSRR